MKGVKANQKDLIKIHNNVYWCKSYLKLKTLRNAVNMIFDGYDIEDIEEEINTNFKKDKPFKDIIYGIFSKSYYYDENGEKIFNKYPSKYSLRFIDKTINEGIGESKEDLTNFEIWGYNSGFVFFSLYVENYKY